MLRPATSQKQCRDFAKAANAQAAANTAAAGAVEPGLFSCSMLSDAEATALVPGLAVAQLAHAEQHMAAQSAAALQTTQNTVNGYDNPQPPVRRLRHRKVQEAVVEPQLQSTALHMPNGVTIHPQRYMHALWAAAEQLATRRADGSCLQLHLQQVQSIEQLQGRCHGPFDAVVVAAGAAVGSIREVGGQLPLDLCQGYTIEMTPPPAECSSTSVDDDDAYISGGWSRSSSASANLNGSTRSSSICHSSRHTQADSINSNTGSINSSSSDIYNTSTSINSSSSSVHSGPESINSDHANITSTSLSMDSSSVSTDHCYPADSSSLLGQPYLASQGGERLVIGATKQHGCSSQKAMQECRRSSIVCQAGGTLGNTGSDDNTSGIIRSHSPSALTSSTSRNHSTSNQSSTSSNGISAALSSSCISSTSQAEVTAAIDDLIAGASSLWPPVQNWQVAVVRSGVRALPPRTAAGSVPMIGRWPQVASTDPQHDDGDGSSR